MNLNLLYVFCISALLLIIADSNPITETTRFGDLEEVTTLLDEITSTQEPTLAEAITSTIEPMNSSPDEEIDVSTDVVLLVKSSEEMDRHNCSHCLSDKYLKHYYAKGCKPIFDHKCNDCPKKFDCDKKVEIVLANDECLLNGTKYKIGESVPMANPCQVCQCGYGYSHMMTTTGLSPPFTYIHCITIECPEHFAVHRSSVVPLNKDYQMIKNCYNVYEPNKCCAVAKICPGTDKSIDEKVCAHENKNYRIGEKIYPKDKCKVCICDETWDPLRGVNNSGCFDVQCNLEIDRQLIEGCIPVYHENTCCPIDYYCPEREQSLDSPDQCTEPLDSGPCVGSFTRFYFDVADGHCRPFAFTGCGGNRNNFRDLEECQRKCLKTVSNHQPNETIPAESVGEIEETNGNDYCFFNGNQYAVGDKLDIGQKCVDCECRVPPDFTCIHRSCPSPPIGNCRVSYNLSACCPVFDCNYNQTTDKVFDPLSCPTPLCDRSCVFETYPDRCPNCVCKPGLSDNEEPDFDISDI